jgi:Cu-Zn family superoxide dismutase
MTKKFWLLVFAPCALALSVGGCKIGDDDDDDEARPTAKAEIKAADGKTLGTATFTRRSKDVKLVAAIKGAATKSVEVGIHIHQKPQCDGGTAPPFTSAGDHWNPGHPDGDYGPKDASPNSGYLGELGKVTLDQDGNGTKEFVSANWRLDTGEVEDVVNRAIILHIVDDTPDDGKGAPRQGCGVIALEK